MSHERNLSITMEIQSCTNSVTEAKGALTMNIESRITDVMHHFGIPRNVKGFHYIRAAIQLVYDDYQHYLNNVTINLYPDVAEQFETEANRVERAIRHAIELGRKSSPHAFGEYFYGDPESKSSVSNSVFIFTVADNLLLEDKKQQATQ